MLKCFRGKKKHMESCFPMCSLFPKKVITVLHCWTRKNVSLPHPVWVSEWDFTATAEHLWKREARGGERQKGEWGKPSLSALQRIWTAEKRNRVSKCQTDAIPAKPHLILLNQQKKIIHCLISLTSPVKGCFFPLLGQSPCCKIPALISAFYNMCCTSAQKESS